MKSHSDSFPPTVDALATLTYDSLIELLMKIGCLLPLNANGSAVTPNSQLHLNYKSSANCTPTISTRLQLLSLIGG